MRTEKEIRTYFEEKGLEEMLGDLEAKTAPFWRPPERLELEMRKTAEGRGFIYITGTNIRYPLVQGQNNYEYLNLSPERVRNLHGSIFIDYRNQSPFNGDFNTIIHGHNMRDGTMFHNLNLVDPREVKTLVHIWDEKENSVWEVFASFVVSDEVWVYQINPDRNEYLRQISFIAEIELSEDLLTTSSILTLSTCTISGEDRVVWQARRL